MTLLLSVAALGSAHAATPTWTVEQTPTWVTITSSTPGAFRLAARVGSHPGELVLEADADGDGRPEAGASVRGGGVWNDGLAGSYRMSCNAAGFVPEYASIRWFPTGVTRGKPYVLVEHYPDGNVHLVLDADRDGRPEAEATTAFGLDRPARSPFCAETFPTPPSVPRPR